MSGWTIDTLTVPDSRARIGLCPYPGRSGSLSDDLEALRDWGARGLLTLIEDKEFAPLGVTSLPEKVAGLGMHWWHLPIRDMDTPDENFEVRWRETGQARGVRRHQCKPESRLLHSAPSGFAVQIVPSKIT